MKLSKDLDRNFYSEKNSNVSIKYLYIVFEKIVDRDRIMGKKVDQFGRSLQFCHLEIDE